MGKAQKIWLWVSLSMFIVPEVLFSFLLLLISGFLGRDFLPLVTLFVKQQVFVDHPLYLLLALFIELLGLLGLTVFSFRSRNKFLPFLFLGSFLILSGLFYIMFYMRHGISF